MRGVSYAVCVKSMSSMIALPGSPRGLSLFAEVFFLPPVMALALALALALVLVLTLFL